MRALAFLLRILAHPHLRRLLKRRMVVLELFSHSGLNCIIGLWSCQHRPNQLENIRDLVGRLPLVRLEHTQAHGSTIIVADVRMVDLGAEGERWWLERVFFGKCDLNVKFSALP